MQSCSMLPSEGQRRNDSLPWRTSDLKGTAGTAHCSAHPGNAELCSSCICTAAFEGVVLFLGTQSLAAEPIELHAPMWLASMVHLLGYSVFSCLNSCSMVSRGRSEMSSMFSQPITCFLSAAFSLA